MGYRSGKTIKKYEGIFALDKSRLRKADIIQKKVWNKIDRYNKVLQSSEDYLKNPLDESFRETKKILSSKYLDYSESCYYCDKISREISHYRL